MQKQIFDFKKKSDYFLHAFQNIAHIFGQKMANFGRRGGGGVCMSLSRTGPQTVNKNKKHKIVLKKYKNDQQKASRGFLAQKKLTKLQQIETLYYRGRAISATPIRRWTFRRGFLIFFIFRVMKKK